MVYRLWSLAAALCGVLATASTGHSADVSVAENTSSAVTLSERWNATLASEVRYFSWKANTSSIGAGPGKGTQVYIPYALQLTGRPNDDLKIDLLGRGGWVSSRQSTAGLTGEVDTFTDTVASATVTYLGYNGVQPFVSLNTNMPSGKSVLLGSAANARMDPDLVEISSFGEGWNIGPSIGFNLPVTPNTVVTMSAGYTWRGSFDRENSLTFLNNAPQAQSLTGIDPGDVFTATAAIAYANGPWSAALLASWSEETKTVESGVPLYKAGRRYLGNATLSYGWPEKWGVSTLTVSMAHSNRNDVLLLGASALVTEPVNTNSNLYRVGLQHLVPLGPFWLGPTGSFLYRDNNSYDSTTLQFVPAKQRYAAGMIGRYAVSEKVTFSASVEHIWTHEDGQDAINGQQFSVLANAFVVGSAVPVVSSTGWQIAGGFNARF